jgi:cell wall-associated NlpC family hydrolase
MPVKGVYLAAAGIGCIMLYAGFKGKRWTDVTHSLLETGKPGSGQPYAITTSPVAFQQGSYGYGGYQVGTGGTASGEAIAQQALQYQGSKYVWGGIPGTTPGVDNGTDCSGFANMVIGRDLGMAIPMYAAGKFHGQAHGPATGSWLIWNGCQGVSQNAPGVLAVWQTHMGICIGGGKMISALDTQQGVVVTTIQGGAPFGEKLFLRELKASG